MFNFKVGNLEYQGLFEYVEEVQPIANSYAIIKLDAVNGTNPYGSCGTSILETYELIFFADCNFQLDFTAQILALIKPLGQINSSTSDKLAIIKRLSLYGDEEDSKLKHRISEQFICSITFSINRICTSSCSLPTESYGCGQSYNPNNGGTNNQTDLALALETLTNDLEELSSEVDDLFVISVSL